MKIRVGSLFSGIGGLDLGLERAGMKVIWQVENDPYANRVLEKHWPNVRRFGDVRECGAHNLEPVDLVCGGFPCQPFSVAGLRKGEADERNLWPETIRILRELRPSLVFLENVPGLLAHKYFGRILGDLAESGFCVEWDCIPASALGAPHRRDRLWIFAYANGRRAHTEQEPGQEHKGEIEPCGDGEKEPMADAAALHRKEIWGANRTEFYQRFWPTPRASDGSHGGRVTPRRSREGGRLIEAVSARMFPTPQARDHFPPHSKEYIAKKRAEGHGMSNLNDRIGGALNPTWVEWLMGFPSGWTALDASETP